MARPRIGLALGSGAARGWAHIGVLRALAEAGVEPHVICGSSIGALVGGVYLSGRLDELETWARALTKLKIIGYLDLQMSGGGMIAGNRLLAVLQQHLGELQIEDLPIPFAGVATDLVNGHEVWLQRGGLVDALRASISLPGVFAPVRVDGRWLIDGGLVNPLPVSVCRAMGAQVTIAVNLNAGTVGRLRAAAGIIPKAPGFDVLNDFSDMAAPDGRRPIGAVLRQVFGRPPGTPGLFSVMAQSLSIVQDRITRSRLAGEPPDVSIDLGLGHIGLLEFDRAAEAIEEGRAAVARVMGEISDAVELSGPPPAQP